MGSKKNRQFLKNNKLTLRKLKCNVVQNLVCHLLTRDLRTHPDSMTVHYKHVFIESVRAHVITIHGKRTGRP